MFIREGNSIPVQSSCLENPMDRGVWWATVHGVAKSQTRLSNFHFSWKNKNIAKNISIINTTVLEEYKVLKGINTVDAFFYVQLVC